MDPNEILKRLRLSLSEDDMGTYDGFDGVRQLFIDLDEWITKRGFIPTDWVSTKLNHRADGEPRMTDAQRNRLWDMCGRYNVPFNEDHYFIDPITKYVEGWIGGHEHAPVFLELAREKFKPTIYTGVSPEGESHT